MVISTAVAVAFTLTTTAAYLLANISGTSGCEDQLAYLRMQQYRFVAVAQDNLAMDIARGSGEYVTTMAYLEGCPTEVHDSFTKMVQHNFNIIFPQPESDPETILIKLEEKIAADPLLAAQCRGIS